MFENKEQKLVYSYDSETLCMERLSGPGILSATLSALTVRSGPGCPWLWRGFPGGPRIQAASMEQEGMILSSGNCLPAGLLTVASAR